MRIAKLSLVLLIAAGLAFGQSAPSQNPAKQTQPPAKRPTPPPQLQTPSPGSKKPATPKAVKSFDLSAMDKTVSPCEDFYRYACGGWMARNPIPSDQARWGRFDELQENNRDILHNILEQAAAKKAGRSEVEQKIGDFYGSCMDEKKVDALGAKPIQADLDRIQKIQSRDDLIATVAYLHAHAMPGLFTFGASPNMHDATQMIANVFQGGLGLPERDYYFKEDPKSVETRQKYVEHVGNMFKLLGDSPEKAAAEAKTVMDVETALAKPSLARVDLRDPAKRDHPMTKEELEQLAPNFEFNKYFAAVGAPAFDKLNVGSPDFFKTISAELDSIPLGDWKTYLRWHVVNSRANALSEPFVEESFRFNQQYLGGQKELQARWKRCVVMTDRMLPELLGQPYVAQNFPPSAKQRTLTMVNAIEKAMGNDVSKLDWMTDATKKAADVKLQAVTNKIGYPDKWRDYSSVKIERNDFAGNVNRAAVFERHRNLNKIGKPVDRKEWGMSPPTVNAYYNPSENNINFPAGILQPPFYDNNADDPVNFGGIGAVIGHELTHGFDDQGAKFDASGNLRDWWTAADEQEFKKRTGCIADEYSQFVAVDDVHLNGKLTLGENTADNGGVRISLMALHAKEAGKQPPKRDGFTADQRFFISFAQIWCQNVTPAQARLRAFTDPHSPGQYRVNGVVSNMPEFEQAFGCKQGQPMVRENACHVW
jgi:putative endopeptidase